MKNTFCISLVLSLLISLTSCSKNDDSDKRTYHGKWELISMMGHGSLGAITGVIIDESTITMTFSKDDHYTALYDEYGASHTVNYTYNEHDIDVHGEDGASLTFDEPLYFANFSDREYITKVFIEVTNNSLFQRGEFLMWHNDSSSHIITFSK